MRKRIKKMPSGKRNLLKKIVHIPLLDDYINSGKIVIEKECKNAFGCKRTKIDYFAYRLLLHVFKRYQMDDELPDDSIGGEE